MPGNTIGTGLIVASAHVAECLLLAHHDVCPYASGGCFQRTSGRHLDIAKT